MKLWRVAAGLMLLTLALHLAADPPASSERKEVDVLKWVDPKLPYKDPATAPIIETPDKRLWITPEQRDAINTLLEQQSIIIDKLTKENKSFKIGIGCS
jgi:hypothetical protein